MARLAGLRAQTIRRLEPAACARAFGLLFGLAQISARSASKATFSTPVLASVGAGFDRSQLSGSQARRRPQPQRSTASSRRLRVRWDRGHSIAWTCGLEPDAGRCGQRSPDNTCPKLRDGDGNHTRIPPVWRDRRWSWHCTRPRGSYARFVIGREAPRCRLYFEWGRLFGHGRMPCANGCSHLAGGKANRKSGQDAQKLVLRADGVTGEHLRPDDPRRNQYSCRGKQRQERCNLFDAQAGRDIGWLQDRTCSQEPDRDRVGAQIQD